MTDDRAGGGLRYQTLPNAPAGEADVVIAPVPLEMTVCGHGGTAAAPAAILAATAELEFFDEFERWSPMKHLTVHVADPIVPTARETLEAFHARLADAAAATTTRGLFVALGGEHAVTPSLCRGRMAGDATVVFFDAHADLRATYQGTAHSHACAAYQLHEAGHRVIIIGARSFYESELDLIAASPRLELFTDDAVCADGGMAAVLERLAAIDGDVWISIDMDVFDPAVAPGVGTPQPGGLDWRRMRDLTTAVTRAHAPRLRGVDIVELVPDPTGVTPITAAKLLQTVISVWGKAMGYETRPETGAQSRIAYE